MFLKIDEVLSSSEISNLVDLIRGSVNRICVTDDIQEIVEMLGSINLNLSRISQSRIMELTEKSED